MPKPARGKFWFGAHILSFVLALCLLGLSANGSGWAFVAASLCLLLSGVSTLFGGRTFLTAQTTRLSIAKRAHDPAELVAAERAAATWTGVVLVALGSLLLYLAAAGG